MKSIPTGPRFYALVFRARLYTSYIATKVMLTGINDRCIKPRSEKPYTYITFKDFIAEKSKKDWFYWAMTPKITGRKIVSSGTFIYRYTLLFS